MIIHCYVPVIVFIQPINSKLMMMQNTSHTSNANVESVSIEKYMYNQNYVHSKIVQ